MRKHKKMTHDFADTDLLFELGELRNRKRNYQYGFHDISVAEHTMRVTFIALMLAKKAGADIEKTLTMALMHDMAEVRTGDASPWQKPYVIHKEKEALHDMVASTTLDFLEVIGDEYEKRESIESQLVKDADMIDTELEMREMRELGSNCLDFFEKSGVRDQIEARMRTDVGRELLQQVRQRNPFDRTMVQNSSLKNNKHGT